MAELCQLLLSNKISTFAKRFLLERCQHIGEVLRLRQRDAISQLGIHCDLRTPTILQTLRCNLLLQWLGHPCRNGLALF